MKYRYRYEVAEEVLRQNGSNADIQRRVMREFPGFAVESEARTMVPAQLGKSTVIAVETNRHDYYGRIQTEILPTAGPRTSQQLLFYSGLFIATLAFGYATLARVLGLAHLGRGQFVAARATPKSPPHSGATLMEA